MDEEYISFACEIELHTDCKGVLLETFFPGGMACECSCHKPGQEEER